MKTVRASRLVLPLTVTKHGASQTVTRDSIDRAINPTSTIAVETPSQAASQDGLMSSARAAWAATAIFRYGDRTQGLGRARFFLETQSPATPICPPTIPEATSWARPWRICRPDRLS